VRQRFGQRLEVHSAGVEPSSIHPLTLRVLREVGIDATGQRAKHVDKLKDIRFDLVVTLCDSARQTCPVFPGTTRLVHRSYPNPEEATGTEEERLAVFRQVRDQLARELPALVEAELGVSPPEPAARA
jgi:arsenate reductase